METYLDLAANLKGADYAPQTSKPLKDY